MRKFELNGKKYGAAVMNFGAICDLEDLGVNLDDFAQKPMGAVRAYVELSTGLTKKEVAAEIEAHIVAGGTLEHITDCLAGEIEESDFFQALRKRQEKEAAEDQSRQENTVNDPSKAKK